MIAGDGDKEIAWRLHCLLEFGYDIGPAEHAAANPCLDIRRVEQLLRAGCPHAIALALAETERP